MTHAAIEFRLLGPLEASVGGAPVALGGPKQRALVALLLLHANDVVPLDVLIEELWEGTPPPSAREYLQNCVSRLRKVLGADAIERRPPGYRLLVEPDAIDARRFERLVREARGRPARERAVALREALELWRGAPLSDLAYWGFAQDPSRMLEEHRINALQMRLEAELELGLHRESVGELDALAREHPTHERLRWLQMLALHRSDRRLDALTAYQEARLAIVEESGMEPGEELRALQRRILQDDPTLMPAGVEEENAVEAPPHLARKVVAVCIVELLVDEDVDVEAARGVLSRGLASLEEIVLRHGGSVEQLLGEEALAVFGLPAAHEDDVLRALRTATELRDALNGVEMRAAVESGEVLVGDDGRILSGGALTTARRVKESTPAGEIHLGSVAAAQSSGAAWTDASNGSHRLLELVEGAPAVARRPHAPLVGRRAELERLVLAVRESAASSSCRRIVVLGEPGIGKTRLAVELARSVENEARVLHGRCVPYADGATYLPLADVVRQIVGDEDVGPALQDVLADETEGELAATRLVEALSGSGAVDSGDVFWAARKLLEALAHEQPVVVVLEDVHWAEPTFLDLLEYVAGWSTGAPITLLCLARTELLDERPAWAADTIPLRPLSENETAELLDAMPEALAIDDDGRAAVVAAAEGNPLFLEQLAAHALDEPLEPGRVPASLESLLASRLDSLKPDERAVLERAAIVGREFTRGAVDALLPDEARGGAASVLLALVRRRLVRPDPEGTAEDAFLFDHALIRDATYAAIAKAERARLHEQLARWLDDRRELDEIVGYHLEQAVLNRRESGDDAEALAEDAASRLGQAGERALASRDHRSALALLTRSTRLLDDASVRRLELECLLSIPLKTLWERDRALDLLDDVGRRAASIRNRRLELRVWVEQIWLRFADVSDPDLVVAKLEETARACEEEDDEFGLARALYALAAAQSILRGRFDAGLEAARSCADIYARRGARAIVDSMLVGCMADGSTPIEDAVTYCESRLGSSDMPRSIEALLMTDLAVLKAYRGCFAESRALLDRGRARFFDVGDEVAIHTRWTLSAATVDLLAREAHSAEELAASGLAAAEAHEDRTWQARFLCALANAALLKDDVEQTLSLADQACDLVLRADPFHAVGWRFPRARALARVGDHEAAHELARETLDLVDATDYLIGRGEARMVLAEVLRATGRNEDAADAAEEGAALFEAKGATLLAEQARVQGAMLRRGEPGERAPLGRG